ncbi:NACHT domain- and WD repeat-containing protein 1-like [Gigantopelta aegis]|uniref:NACHT domain- and WD repeat-containing protein 1-like n=1 Tax=Gigantopelta aegis TaxID=1735272 RepID=UPI001B88E097|nr:NACHT domain- and WD repeat-containing protein 1-like [Gigantopelta aegis]
MILSVAESVICRAMGCGSSKTPGHGDLPNKHTTDPGDQRKQIDERLEKNSESYKQKSLELTYKTPKENNIHRDKSKHDKPQDEESAKSKTHMFTNVSNERPTSNTASATKEDANSSVPPLPPSLPVPQRRKSRRFSTDERIKNLEKVLQQQSGDYDLHQRPKTRGGGDRPKTSQTKYRRRQSEIGLHREHVGSTSGLIIQGKVDLECPSTAKIVRIFTSSTFTDTFHERNTLMEKVYPNLKKVCQEEGYEFQVVDMRWGVRDEATDDHMTTELCLREVELCKKLSTGPCFVTFLSHKYGYRSFPRLIPADEFQKLTDVIQLAEAKEVIQKWFMRDDNAVPPTYVLQPISSLLPDFKSSDSDLRSRAKKAWYDDSAIMQDAIVPAASQCLDTVTAHKYEMSVTEAEIREGLFTDDKSSGKQCVWFHRIIEDIEKKEPNYQLSRYMDCLGPAEKVKESRQLLDELKKALPERIPKNHLILYKIKWSENGVDPVKSPQHKEYIRKLCVDFESSLLKMIKDGIKTRLQTDLANPLFEEIVQQTLFCQEKCKAFHGRHDTLEKISHYLVDKSRIPFVVYGQSGCGKTSIVAMAAKSCWDKFGGNVVVIIRFIGTTPDSSTIGALLRSVTLQIMKVYGQQADDMPVDIKELTDAFHKSLKLASEKRPLVILMDSLDQFDPSWGARQLGWLPQNLPPHVKIIVSTLPEAQYESLPRLKALYPSEENFLDVPKLPDNDVSGILDKWLETNGRKLTDFQRRKVMTAFQKCPLPLFLKLSFDQACRWTSYAPTDQTILQTTVRGSIDALLARVEQLHGKLFVSHALAYLTLSKSGLTESELEDILSCDDEVLNDVYTYWTPPMRRLPPFLLVRLKAELGQYLVDRGADGVRVFYWYHRQFIEAARDRYCSDESETRKRHMDLAEFFSGTWSAGKLKAYKDNKGNASEADRLVTLQPLKFGSAYNFRKLTNLPYHRLEARQMEELKTECLLSFDFIFAKLHAIGLRQVLDDFSEARKVLPNDPELKTLTETFQLSQDALISYPDELPSQVLGRIYNPKSLEQFLEDCRNSPSYYLLPNQKILTPPGGKLVHCLAGHKGDVTSIALSPDGQIAATCAADKSIKFWSITEGKLVRSTDGVGDDPDNLHFCCNGKIVLVGLDYSIQGYIVETGVPAYSIDLADTGRMLFCPCGKNNSLVGIVFEKHVQLYDAMTGKLQHKIECNLLNSEQDLGDFGMGIGSERYLACTDSDQFWVFVVDLATKSFIHKVQPFLPFTTEDGDEDQYTIEAMAMSSDGKVLIIANCYDNNLNVYDIKTMKKKHEWKGHEKDFSEKFRFTSNCKTLYFPSRREIVVWNLKDGTRSVILQHPVNILDVVTTNLHTVVTVGDDRVVRIWDTSREEIEDSHKGQTDGPEENTKEDIQLKHIELMENPRYLLQDGKDVGNFYLQVFDLAKSKVIREAKLSNACGNFKPFGDHHAILRINRKLKLLDLMTMTFIKTFQGKLSPSGNFFLINHNKEILCSTRGRENMKVLSIDSGKAIKVMETQQTMLIDSFVVNKPGTFAAVGLDEGPIVLFNLKTYTLMYLLTKQAVGMNDDLYIQGALITDDGKYFVFEASKVPKETHHSSEEIILLSWDITTKKLAAELADLEYYNRYQDAENNELDTGVESFVLLNDNTVLANLNDGIIRMYNLKTGVIKQRFDGHIGSATISVVPGRPYVLTYGTWVEDNTFQLLDKNMKRLATYSPDYDINQVELTKDGYHVVGFMRNQSRPVVWELKGEPSNSKPDGYSHLDSFPAIFGDDVLEVGLTLLEDDDEQDDPDDLDKEEDEQDDTDDDDDDEDDDDDDLNFDDDSDKDSLTR